VNPATRVHESVTLALQVPHCLPAEPFDRSRLALWFCRSCAPWGEWNAPDRPHCRTCAAPRP
jgi:hypothetical protein